ncbi:MAG: hypothetical protein Q7S84_00795 [bacterium]|nr:hypothetical protein [bacterium]
MLVLADYCKRWYVSLLTLKSIFEPEGSTQLRFMEGSKQCWYFLPGPYAGGHMLYLDSIRYIAVVQSSVAAFGKDAKLPCFMRELSRIGGVPFSEVRAGIWKLEESIATPPLLLKPWQEQATSLWNHFCSQSYVELADELRYLFSFKRGYYPVAIFFVVAAQRRKLRELSTVREIREVSFPADFGTSITVAIRSIATSLTTFQQDQRSWWSDFQKYFGIQ